MRRPEGLQLMRPLLGGHPNISVDAARYVKHQVLVAQPVLGCTKEWVCAISSFNKCRL